MQAVSAGRYYANLQFPIAITSADKDDRQWRRGVYMHWQRTFLHPMLANFDAPSREECIADAHGANTPQQALTLLNDPDLRGGRAGLWRGRLLAAAPRRRRRASTQAYQQALARSTKAAGEAPACSEMPRPTQREEYRAAGGRDEAAERRPRRSAGRGAIAVELAAWTSVCRVILNLHETITRY